MVEDVYLSEVRRSEYGYLKEADELLIKPLLTSG